MASELRAVVLPLYRNILRLHRDKLPPVMREIGDKYVKTEFKAHNNAKTTEPQWREFVTQWRLYVSTLDGSGGAPGSAEENDWAAERLREAKPEQQEQLEKLRHEAALLREKEADG